MSIPVEKLREYRFSQEDMVLLKRNRKQAQKRYRELSKKHTMSQEDRHRVYDFK
jgi:hypothetical protein